MNPECTQKHIMVLHLSVPQAFRRVPAHCLWSKHGLWASVTCANAPHGICCSLSGGDILIE